MPHSPSVTGLGIGHLPILHENILKSQALFDFVEVTPESYIGGDPELALAQLEDITAAFEVTCHGIDLSFASADPVNLDHLIAARGITNSCNASFFSEHMAYTKAGELNADRFFTKVATQADNGIILNIDSISISARLQGINPLDLVAAYPPDRVVSLTVVPESCMNPIIRQICGGFDKDMLSIVQHCLNHTAAQSVLVQTRYAENTVDSLSEIINSLRSLLCK